MEKETPKYIGMDFNEYLTQNLTNEEKEYVEARANFLVELSDIRRESNLTQKELAEKTGLSQSTIAKIERGSINPSINNILKLLAAMGKTLKIASL